MFLLFEQIFMVFLYAFLFAAIAGGIFSLFEYAHGADRRLKIDFKAFQ